MLIVKETSPGQFKEIPFGSSFTGSGGALHGWQCVELWSDSQLAQVGVYKIDPAALPSDPEVIVNGYHFERVAGKVTQVYNLIKLPPKTKQQLKEYSAAKRYQVEVGGIASSTYGPILTDRDTRSIVGQTIQSIDLGIIQAPVNFKTPNGFVPLDRVALVVIATIVAAHVQTTFDKEATIGASIDAGTITTTAQIDAAYL